MKNNYARTPTVEMWLGDDGIARIIILPNMVVSMEDNHENMKYIPKVFGDKTRPIYLDIRNIMWSDQLSRKFVASDDISAWFDALAIIVDSLASRTLGNLVLHFIKLPYPTRIFASEKEALEWLKLFVE